MIKTDNRVKGIQTLFKAAALPNLQGKKIIIKPNYNSDDPFPATTHIDTLKTVIEYIKANTPEAMVITERSGMGDTESVLENRGVLALAVSEEVGVINLDALSKEAWSRRGTEEGWHWRRGFMVPNVVLEADYIINIPCLKTHRFGGDFTMALKNNVGIVAKWHGLYNYMWELHASPDQRLMIAEINKELAPQIIIMDGIKGFSTKGPEQGKIIEPGIMMLSTDPVAIDAVGVVILRHYGTTEKVASGPLFEQEQLKRAAELGIGASSVDEIELVAVNKAAEKIVAHINDELRFDQ